MDHEQTGRV